MGVNAAHDPDHCRADAQPVSRIDGVDGCQHRHANNRQSTGRSRKLQLGIHRFHARLNNDRSAVRQTLRSFRATTGVRRSHGDLSDRIGALRSGGDDAATDRLPHYSGDRRWRVAAAGVHHHRRPVLTGAARPVARAVFGSVGHIVDRRTVAGRFYCRSGVVAVDFLDQHLSRSGGDSDCLVRLD
jgi:hypothetical protein